jgi:hypothetical protein
MTAEGFGADAVGVAQVNNWFVDIYENGSKVPFSGHAGSGSACWPGRSPRRTGPRT